MSATEQTLVPGTPAEWLEFSYDDYDPEATPGGDEDLLGMMLADRTGKGQVGVVIVTDPIARIDDRLIKRLTQALIPTKLRRGSRGGGKVSEKKEKKAKKHKK